MFVKYLITTRVFLKVRVGQKQLIFRTDLGTSLKIDLTIARCNLVDTIPINVTETDGLLAATAH